jgi:hypothetical protein
VVLVAVFPVESGVVLVVPVDSPRVVSVYVGVWVCANHPHLHLRVKLITKILI